MTKSEKFQLKKAMKKARRAAGQKRRTPGPGNTWRCPGPGLGPPPGILDLGGLGALLASLPRKL